ncbi:alpha/beta hydrolase [Flavobacterium akiainvivens]|uniref:alpha/beta hydrolase n=1 Tax=Flavobacterium akiainvivens TaxID=1202724 RepID=UPI0008E73FD5|nr:alpha/beta hydrolase-fold protein [Flavobacterium akiainvivens]SFQ51922.1 Predicted hydrolase of the alpha/beta superfamily [Flavobacterium akiainvivens]
MKLQEKGTVEEITLHATTLGRDKTIWVYLPYDYANAAKHYPVIYMHDGQHVFNRADSPKHDWFLEDKLNVLHSEAIIVGIEHGGSTHRLDELTPYKNEKHGGGHADDYLDFLVNELKPYVDGHYKTLTDAPNTTIFGSSVGGLISFYALLKFPDVYGNAGVFSPSFWYSEEIFELIKSVDSISGRIYLMAGDHESKDMVPDLERMEKLILERIAKPTQLHKKIVAGGHHNEKLWRHEFADAYKWLIGVYILSEDERKAIAEAKNDIASGNTISNEDVNHFFDKWLKNES